MPEKLNPMEKRTYRADIPPGESPKHIELDVGVDIWDDNLMVAVALSAFFAAGGVLGWGLHTLLNL